MPNVSFHPYQVEGIIRAYHALKDPQARGAFYVQWKPGMGKTLGAIALHRKLGTEVPRMRTLVVCPVVAQGVWEREFEKWLPGTKVVRDSPTDDCDVVVISYDKIKDPKSDNPLHQRRTGSDRLHVLQTWSPVLLILDEAQYVKSPSTSRTRAVWKLAATADYKLLLSGTPAHSPLDWWSQFRIVAPHEAVFKMTYQQFKAYSVEMQSGPGGASYPLRGRNGAIITRAGFKDVIDAMAPYVHAVSKEALGLAAPVETEVPIELTPRERKAYSDMEQFLRHELKELGDQVETNATIVLTQMLRLSQIAAGHATADTGDVVTLGDSKARATMELLDEREDEKVVVACRFRHDIAQLGALLEAQNRPYRVIDGSVSAVARTRAEDWFQTEEHNGVMLLNYRAGGVAITLSKASTIIMHTLCLSVIEWEQMISRVHRIGTTTNVQVLYPLASNTHDEVMLSALRRGASQVDMARLLLRYLNRIDGGAS